MLDKIDRDLILHDIMAGYSERETAIRNNVTRTTVRRIKNSSYSKRSAGENLNFLNVHKDEILGLAIKYKCNCNVLCRKIEEKYKFIIGIRMMERFMKSYRKELNNQQNEETKRFETPPGNQLQIDFGEIVVKIYGKEQKIHFFVAVLSYSRRIYAKAYLKENQDAWLDGIESSFRYFEGIPKIIVCDNTKSLIIKHNSSQHAELTERFEFLSQQYCVKIIACTPHKPRSKGKVERSVQYVKNNCLLGNEFTDIEHINNHIIAWCSQIADNRILKDKNLTGENTPNKRWIIESLNLNPIKTGPINNLKQFKRKVDKNSLIRIDNKSYKIPKSFANKIVTVIVGKDICVFCSDCPLYQINEAKDLYTYEQQDWSNSQEHQVEFTKRLEELQNAPEWHRTHENTIQRPTNAYDHCFDERGQI